MGDAIRILGLYKFTPAMIVRYVTDMCDEDGTVTEATFHQGIIKLIRKYYITLPLMDRPLADHILQRLFVVFQDYSNNRCTFTDVATALLVFCGGSLDRKAKAAFSLYSQKHDPSDEGSVDGISHEGISSCLTAIFKIVSDLDPGHHFDSMRNCAEIANELATNIFKQNPQYRYSGGRSISARGSLPLEAFTIVFRQIMLKFDACIDAPIENTVDQELGSDMESNYSVEVKSIHSNSSDEYMETLQRMRSGGGGGVAVSNTIQVHSDEENTSDSENDDVSQDVSNGAAHHGDSVHKFHEHVYANEVDNIDNSSSNTGTQNSEDSTRIVSELQQARQILHMNGLSCHDILDILSEFSTASGTSVSNQLSLSSWLLVLTYFAKLNSATQQELNNATFLGQRLFAAVANCSKVIGSPTHTSKTASSTQVPYINMAIGLSLVLCENQNNGILSQLKNLHEDKLLMVFTLLDFDNDNMINRLELCQLVTCVLVVLQTCSASASNHITLTGENVYELGERLTDLIFQSRSKEEITSDSLITFEDLKEFATRTLLMFDM